MLIDKDGNCVKKKRRKSTYKKAKKRKLRSFQLGLGMLFTAAALLCVVIVLGIGQITSRAVEELTFETNSGSMMSGSEWTVMDGAQIKIKDYVYSADKSHKIYYKAYENPLTDPSGILLNEGGGTQYTGNVITLKNSGYGDGSVYLYVQQFEGNTAQRIDGYHVSFYESAPEVKSTPETSDSEMTTLKIGDSIHFSGSGTLYYTMGETPYFERAAFGESAPDLIINKEAFVVGDSEKMKPLPRGNVLQVPIEWMSKNTVTIRVISASEGKDFSKVTNFRFKLALDQVETPVIAPLTTAETPVVVANDTRATLVTGTKDAVILYTIGSGSIPSYRIVMEGNEYKVMPETGTYIYNEQDAIIVNGKPGGEFTITAKAVKIDAASGKLLMTDSEPVQFVYKFSELDIAKTPDSSPKSGTAVSLGDKIYLNTETGNGKILYTLDGTSPSYTVSNGEIQPAAGTYIYGANASEPCIAADSDAGAERGKDFLIQAKTVCLDETGEKLMEDSQVVQFLFPVNEADTVAAPAATPVTTESKPTTVEPGDTIILSTSTTGAKIYYTMDGSAPVPGEASTLLYEGNKKIQVPDGSGYLTLTAIAVKEEMNDSAIVQFIYQYPAIVAPPYCSPAESTVSINTEVELASLDKDALIYYTLDGSIPTALTGKLYTDPLMLTSSTTIKAICVVNGISSSVRTFQFEVSPQLMPPSPSIASGAVVTSGTAIKLSAQSGAEIAYTTDGSNPKSGSPMFGNTVTVTGKPGETVTLITYAKGADYSESQTATYVYTISNYENGIKVTPENETKVSPGEVIRLETDVTGGVIYYAVGGNVPTSSSATGNQVLVPAADGDDSFILKAAAVAGGTAFPNSIASFHFPYLSGLAAPKASIPDGAVLLKKQLVELTAEGGNIYYTTDGQWPDENANLYTERIAVDQQMTILAFTMNEEGAKSEVVAFTYTFASQAAKPQFSIQGGEVETGTKLTIRSDTPDAKIYYTLDGTEPDLNNQKNLYTYSGMIQITKPMQIKAIAVKDKMTESAVSGALFTVKEPEPVMEQDEEEADIKGSKGERLMTRRSYMGTASGPSYTDHVLKNAMTGVVISAQEGTMPIDVLIDVSEISANDVLNGSILEADGDLYEAAAGYEVKVLQNGELITLAEDVEVGLPIPARQRNSAIYLAAVDEEGNVELLNTRRDDDMAYAFTRRFGRFCIVAPTSLDETEDHSNYKMFLAGGTMLLLAAGYLLLRKARKKGETDE